MLLNYSSHCCLLYGQKVLVYKNGFSFQFWSNVGLEFFHTQRIDFASMLHGSFTGHGFLTAFLRASSFLNLLFCSCLTIPFGFGICLYTPSLLDLLSSNSPLIWELVLDWEIRNAHCFSGFTEHHRSALLPPVQIIRTQS